MGNFKDELNKAVKEAKEILGSKTTEDIKSSTKEAVSEAKEIFENLESKGINDKLVFLSWSGRLNRVSFFIQGIIALLFLILESYIAYKARGFVDADKFMYLALVLYSYLYFCIVNKRFHDLGKSFKYSIGMILSIWIALYIFEYWWFLIYILFTVIAMSLKHGNSKENKYGVPEHGVKIGKYVIYEGDILKEFKEWYGAFKNEIINNIIYNKLCRSMLINKKKILMVGVSLIILFGVGYYFYIPKISDVEKYQQEKNVAGMCELIDKTFIPLEDNDGEDKYREVRSRAIVALAEMHDSEGIKFLENKILEGNNLDYQIKSEIIQALVQADNKYIENICKKYITMADTQKDFDDKIKIYDELYRFSETDVSEDYICAVIYKEALKNLNNNTATDSRICEYINQKIFPGRNYLFTNKSTYEKYSKLVNLFSTGYENHIIEEINSEIEEARNTINSVNSYFSPMVQESIRETTRQIYALQGQEAALEYINETFKTSDKNIKSYWAAQDKINKLNYRKNHIAEERVKALEEKNKLYNILHNVANRYGLEVYYNFRDTFNKKIEVKPLGYTLNIQYAEIQNKLFARNDEQVSLGRLRYSPISRENLNYTAFIQNKDIKVLDAWFDFDNSQDKLLKEVGIFVQGDKDEIISYLTNLYGDCIYMIEGSKGAKYMTVCWGNKDVLITYSYIDDFPYTYIKKGLTGKESHYIRICDRKWYERFIYKSYEY